MKPFSSFTSHFSFPLLHLFHSNFLTMLPSSTPDSSGPSAKPTILHLGTAIYLNPEIYTRFLDQFNIINPPLSELSRPNFLRHLREKTWGDFNAIIRPFWNTGGEMGRWDRELVELLPESVKVYASAGAGFDWIDTACLADYGKWIPEIRRL